MGYLRCESCGAKALSAASKCPLCASPFSLHDGRGERVALKKCSGCGIMHRRDRTCHWCGERKTAAWRSPAVLKSAAGIAAVSLLAVGSWSLREPARQAFVNAFDAAPAGRLVQTSDVPSTAEGASTLPPAAQAPMLALDSMKVASAEGTMVGDDSTQWVPAVARTWVNVRRDASLVGDVVGVIKPSAKAMLGIGRSGWRQVKSPDVSGWVDPRLFEADSIGTRG